jgi:predicted NBD/HSP70 family sugar kinase
MRTGSLESLRARNRRAVVAAVQANPASSRADIARRTGLSTTTVSTLVGELIARDVLCELGPAREGAGGRPAVALGINPQAGAALGIHLGHAATRVVLAGPDGSVRAERSESFDVDHEPARTLERVAAAAADLIADSLVPRDRIFGAGVAVSAPVLGSRALGSPPMLLDWGEVDVSRQLGDALDLPVYLGNDATLGALAEWRLGAGAGRDDLIYVMLSEGVGAGLVLGGRLHDGATGAAGEFGHVRVRAEGHVCRCGSRGCLETIVGARALVAALAHTRGPQCTVELLLQLSEDGDRGARRLLADAGRAVGDALSSICTVLDPAVVVIGGDLVARPSAAGVLAANARDALNHALPAVGNHAIDVVASGLGARSEVLGAALLAAEHADARIADLADAS